MDVEAEKRVAGGLLQAEETRTRLEAAGRLVSLEAPAGTSGSKRERKHRHEQPRKQMQKEFSSRPERKKGAFRVWPWCGTGALCSSKESAFSAPLLPGLLLRAAGGPGSGASAGSRRDFLCWTDPVILGLIHGSSYDIVQTTNKQTCPPKIV